ncbi:neuronal PAS domain-containing protein 4 [Elysia marginata]|uniref:Neuronal PAS domain-containing protein 4 n=1 Tax=Elysia marginata TaxID=1093978 RepID=A0AAV4JWU3_9GAST|nr:neuronal PAS domain-containing protein 4 [Elysia marginata]
MHVRGHFITVRNPENDGMAETSCVFMATCSPLITPDLKETLVQSNTMVFKTVHKLDMSFIEITKNAEHHLGCSSEDLANKSWYTVLHPEDIHQAKEKHMQLIHSNHEMGCMVTVRMLRADGSSFWVNSVMQVRQSNLPQSDEAFIVCISQIIDENEAYQIKLQAHMFSVYPSRAHELWGSHLSAMTTGTSTHDHLQTGHVAPNMRWIQQDGTAAVPMPGYHGNIGNPNGNSMPTYQAQVSGSRRMMPYHQTLGHQSTMMVGHHRHGSVAHYDQAQPIVQTDQLKAMLKRKIKGPQQQQPDCKPLKIPKLEHPEGADMQQSKQQGMNGYSNNVAESTIPRHFYHQGQYHLPSSFQFMPQSTQNVQVMQVMQPEVHSFKFKQEAGFTLNGSMPAFVNTDNTISLMGSEQVVPDVNVPESFLTPEPSPISSPQPSTSIIIEEQVTQLKKGSVNIIQALEKLAAMPHQMQLQKTHLKDAKMSLFNRNGPSMQASTAQRKRELPIFDAFDIDNFFDALDPPTGKSKESIKMEDVQVKKEIGAEDLSKLHDGMDGLADEITIKCEALSPPSSVCSMSPVHRAVSQSSPTHNYNQLQQIHQKNEISLNSSCMKVSAPCRSAKPNFDIAGSDLDVQINGEVELTNQKSPVSMSSCSPTYSDKQESLDDLLSYFSDDGADLSPLHHMSHHSSVSSSDDLLDEDYFQQNHQQYYRSLISKSSHPSMALSSPAQHSLEELSSSHLQESHCMMKSEQLQHQVQKEQKSPSAQHVLGELSPSSSSSLAGEDEITEERTALTFDIALKMLDMQEQDAELLQLKKDSLDELGFILDSLVPLDNSLEMIKPGQ